MYKRQAQNNLVEWIVAAVKEERVLDVSDVRNESGREAQTLSLIHISEPTRPY